MKRKCILQMRKNAKLAFKISGYTEEEFYQRQMTLTLKALENGYTYNDIFSVLKKRNMSKLSIMAAD